MYERGTMMKKLLVLSLVLAVSAMSSAAWVITAPTEVMAGEVFEIVIANDTGLPGAWFGGLYGSGASAAAGNGLAGEAMFGSLSGAAYDAAYDGWEIALTHEVAAVVQPIPAGDLFRFTATAGAAGEVYDFEFFDYDVTLDGPVQSFSVTSVIPEPMTMGLLGLGALFLRRRK